MSKRKVETVAFPAFGTGKLGYPIRDTAKAMFDAVEEHIENTINSSVKQVFFVLYQFDQDTCQVCFFLSFLCPRHLVIEQSVCIFVCLNLSGKFDIFFKVQQMFNDSFKFTY